MRPSFAVLLLALTAAAAVPAGRLSAEPNLSAPRMVAKESSHWRTRADCEAIAAVALASAGYQVAQPAGHVVSAWHPSRRVSALVTCTGSPAVIALAAAPDDNTDLEAEVRRVGPVVWAPLSKREPAPSIANRAWAAAPKDPLIVARTYPTTAPARECATNLRGEGFQSTRDYEYAERSRAGPNLKILVSCGGGADFTLIAASTQGEFRRPETELDRVAGVLKTKLVEYAEAERKAQEAWDASHPAPAPDPADAVWTSRFEPELKSIVAWPAEPVRSERSGPLGTTVTLSARHGPAEYAVSRLDAGPGVLGEPFAALDREVEAMRQGGARILGVKSNPLSSKPSYVVWSATTGADGAVTRRATRLAVSFGKLYRIEASWPEGADIRKDLYEFSHGYTLGDPSYGGAHE
jgi:hypothetical protein